MATLVLMQITGAAIFFLIGPPPPPFTAHVSEIADALKRSAERPQALVPSGPVGGRRLKDMEPVLARHLGAQADDVRLWISDRGRPGPIRSDPTRIDPILGPDYVAAYRSPGGWVALAGRPPEHDRLLARIGLWLFVCLVLILPLAVTLGYRLTRPIAAFAAAAERLGLDPRAPPLAVKGPAEVRLAARTFNAMQDRIRTYVDDRIRLVGAIAHDLRTPLTRLKLQLSATADPVRSRAELEIDQMEQMIEGALTFARAAAGGGRAPLHLLSLVEAVVDDLVELGLPVRIDSGPDPVVVGDALGLRRVVDNLVRNAVAYGGSATCRVGVDGGRAVIVVEDEGPGLPEEALERVFEPFVRGEPSRNAATGGVGLGLSIVRTIVEAHGGEARLSNRAGGGLSARIALPLAG